MYLNTLTILYYISKLNFVAHGVKFGVFELICTFGFQFNLPERVKDPEAAIEGFQG